jgi:hypothetical protein
MLQIENLSIPALGSIGKLSVGRGVRSTTQNMVGLAERAVDVQVEMPTVVTEHDEKRGKFDVLRGTEFVGTINNLDTVLSGSLLKVAQINPGSFFDTRIAQFNPLYQRYRFRRLNFIYEPVANATQSGQLIGFCDYDPDLILVSDTVQNISTAAAHQGQQICQIWQPQVFPFGVTDDYTTLYTSLEDDMVLENRLIFQGVFYLIAASDLPVGPMGNIYIEYECEFYIPQLASPASGVSDWSLTWASIVGSATGISGSNPFGPSVSPFTPYTSGGFGTFPQTIANTYAVVGGVGQWTLHQVPAGFYVVQVSNAAQITLTATSATPTFFQNLQVISGASLSTFGYNYVTDSNAGGGTQGTGQGIGSTTSFFAPSAALVSVDATSDVVISFSYVSTGYIIGPLSQHVLFFSSLGPVPAPENGLRMKKELQLSKVFSQPSTRAIHSRRLNLARERERERAQLSVAAPNPCYLSERKVAFGDALANYSIHYVSGAQHQHTVKEENCVDYRSAQCADREKDNSHAIGHPSDHLSDGRRYNIDGRGNSDQVRALSSPHPIVPSGVVPPENWEARPTNPSLERRRLVGQNDSA